MISTQAGVFYALFYRVAEWIADHDETRQKKWLLVAGL